MRNIIVGSIFLLAGCGSGFEEPSGQTSEEPVAHQGRSPQAQRAVKTTLLNGRTIASLLAETLADRDYAASRTLSDELMAEQDKATLDKLGLAGDDAATADEIMRDHREARLRVQDLITALTSAGVSGEELSRAIDESGEMARAKPAYLHQRLRTELGHDKLKRFEAASAAIVSPGLERPSRLRAEEGGAL